MPLKNFSNIGELQEYEFITGEIVSLDYENDTCEIIIEGDTKTGVPIFYHCNPSAQERKNGAVQGGAFGFAKEDKVVVMRQQKPTDGENAVKIFVIGHKSGARPCKPLFIIYATNSGNEACVWDVLNNVLVLEKTTLATAQTTLTSWGVTEQTECGCDDKRYLVHHEYVPETWSFRPIIYDRLLHPTNSAGKIDNLWFANCSYTATSIYDTIQSGYQYVRYYQNPISKYDQTPIPGCLGVVINGTIELDDWSFGDIPVQYNQIVCLAKDSGDILREYVRFAIADSFIFMKGIFDFSFSYKDNENVESNIIYFYPESNLSKDWELIFRGAIENEYYHIDTVPKELWVDSFFYFRFGSETKTAIGQNYDFYTALTNAGLTAYREQTFAQLDTSLEKAQQIPPFYLSLPKPAFLHINSGIATNGDSDDNKISVLFEYLFYHSDQLDLYEKISGASPAIWDTTSKSKLRESLRINFRYPYFKNNMDAVLFSSVNKLRTEAGRDPLESNWNLYVSAQRHADYLSETFNVLEMTDLHSGDNGSEPMDRIIEEGYPRYVVFDEETLVSKCKVFWAGENALSVPFGIPVQLERGVDAENIDIPESYKSFKTDEDIIITTNNSQTSHYKDGTVVKTPVVGWKQSVGHYNNIIFEDFTEAGLATSNQKINTESTYYFAVQNFGKIDGIAEGQGYADTETKWAGFASMDTADLLQYVSDNFVFSVAAGNYEELRCPRVFLCTIP